jgi:lysophospholipase L1-like esterase
VSQWQGAHLRNIDIVTNQTSRIDVAFIGDSITEHWIGTDVGSYNKKNDKVAEVFTRFFTEKGGGKYQGLALGISGDKCNELLFRLQDGELPLDAGVFWILIGANDLGMGCGTDVVLAGVIANVEYVLQERPLATVVINSLLPSLVKDQKAHETPYILLTQWVNDRLECYAKSHSRVEFFNATGIFIRNDQVVGISDFVHPSGEGSEAWAAAIVEKLEKLL